MRKIINIVVSIFCLGAGLISIGLIDDVEASGGENNSTHSTQNSDSECNGSTFLTFRPWYYNVNVPDEHGKCAIKTKFDDQQDFVNFIWTIVLNILSNLFSAVGYLAIGFLIYGGYTYVLAKGSPDKIAKGKKIITAAISGLIICILATITVNAIVDILLGSIS